MRPLALHLKTMNVYAHAAHNLVARVPFFADHKFLEHTYKCLDDDYDAVVERLIMLQGEDAVGFPTLTLESGQRIQTMPLANVAENSVYFTQLLTLEQEMCKIIKDYVAQGVNPGVATLLGNIYDKSECRQYKISRRLKK